MTKMPTRFFLILFSFMCFSLRPVQGVVHSSPTNLTALSTSNSITLTWTRPVLAEEVRRYLIMYTYTVRGCSTISSQVTVLVNDSYTKNYTIANGPMSPIEEDSTFNITVFAEYDYDAANESRITYTVIHTPQAAPSGSPQAVKLTSVNLFNASLQWERVDCSLRNGRIYGYRVSYYPTAESDDSKGTVLVGTGNASRMLTITRLQPRTSYTFVVMAINLAILAFGPAATITFHTSIPENITFAVNGQLYGNNSIVTVSDIGEDVHSALFCITNNLECCGSDQPNATTGEWYLPSGRRANGKDQSGLFQSKGPSALYLFQTGATASPPNGVYHCHIPDARGTLQSVYIGVYIPDLGSPSVVSLTLDQQDSSLICVSTGGPATTVIWKRNDIIILSDANGDYQQIQTVLDTQTATYENKLFGNELVGNFTCTVINSRGRAETMLLLNGPLLHVDVASFCSVVVWSIPQVPYEELTGYEVRLYDPDSGQEVIHNVSRLLAHYTISDRDKTQLRLEKAYVQARVLHSFIGPQEWSAEISLGCKASPKHKGIHFIHEGRFYPNNSKIALCTIGEADNALMCKTDFVNCCRTRPNRFGKFFYPNGIQVSIKNRGHSFYRDRGEQEVRLHKREGVVSPIGKFRCEIPDGTGELQSIYIELV